MSQSGVDFADTASLETSTGWYARRPNDEPSKWALSIQTDAIMRMLAPYPGATILNLGGYGALTETLIRRQFDVTVGGSEEAGISRILPFVERDICKFEVLDFLRLPFEDQSFGIVMSHRLLPQVRDWRQFVAEMARVAQKCIIIDYPERHSFGYFAAQASGNKGDSLGKDHLHRYFRGQELVEEFYRHHFCHSESYPEVFLPMSLHRTVKAAGLSVLGERFFRRVRLTERFGSPVIMKLLRER